MDVSHWKIFTSSEILMNFAVEIYFASTPLKNKMFFERLSTKGRKQMQMHFSACKNT